MAETTLDKTDCPGLLAEKVLSYRAMIDEGRELQYPEPGEPVGSDPLPRCVSIPALHMRDADSVFETLQKTVDGRTSEACDDRQADYFWDLFPYRDFRPYKAKRTRVVDSALRDTGQGSQTITLEEVWNSGALYDAYLIAKELNSCEYLLKNPPSKWPEQSIFQKEAKHAENINNDAEFCRERLTFFKKYDLQLKGVSSILLGDLELPAFLTERLETQYSVREALGEEWLAIRGSLDEAQLDALASFCALLSPEQELCVRAFFAKFSDLEDLQVERLPEKYQMQFDLALICARYALAGFSRSEVVARPFRLRMAGSTALIDIPNYMTIDIRRDLSSRALKMFRERRRPDVDLYPVRSLGTPLAA